MLAKNSSQIMFKISTQENTRCVFQKQIQIFKASVNLQLKILRKHTSMSFDENSPLQRLARSQYKLRIKSPTLYSRTLSILTSLAYRPSITFDHWKFDDTFATPRKRERRVREMKPQGESKRLDDTHARAVVDELTRVCRWLAT